MEDIFQNMNQEQCQKKIIIYADLANGLFSSQNPIDKQVSIKEVRYTVSGTFKKEMTGMFDQGMDNAMLIPIKFCIISV